MYKELQLDLTYPEINEEPDHIWSVLFTTGYLTHRGMNDFGEYELVIPNREICSIFIEKIDKWFSNKIKRDTDGLNRLIDAVESGDSDEVQDYLNDCMADSISFLDGGAIEVRENFYHGMLIGMLKTNRAYAEGVPAKVPQGKPAHERKIIVDDAGFPVGRTQPGNDNPIYPGLHRMNCAFRFSKRQAEDLWPSACLSFND